MQKSEIYKKSSFSKNVYYEDDFSIFKIASLSQIFWIEKKMLILWEFLCHSYFSSFFSE